MASPVTAPADQLHPNAIAVDVTVDSVDVTATTDVVLGGTTDNVGGGLGFDSLNPYLGINFIIALLGIFPSPN